MTAGMVLVAVQLVLFSRLGVDATFWNLLPALLIGGVGMALTMTPSAAAATRSVPVDKAGVGSAVLNSARQVGGTMGIAVMGAIMAARGRRRPTRSKPSWTASSSALLVAAGIAIAGAVVAFALVRPHEGAGERAESDQRRPNPPRRTPARSRARRGPKGDSFARRPAAACRARPEGRGHVGETAGFPPRTENAPGCGSGGVSRSRRPLPGVASR